MKSDGTFRVLICDDDEYFYEVLKEYLCRNSSLREAVFLYSGCREDALRVYKKVKPDIVFMDIEVGKDIGFNIIKELLHEGYSPLVIYITNYANYVFDAFIGRPLGFVRKQNMENDLAAVMPEVNRVFQKKLKTTDITSGTVKYTLKLYEIIAFEIFIHDMTVHYSDDRELKVRYTLKKMEEELIGCDFVKISRNTLININYIKEVSKNAAIMTNGRKFYISSGKITEVKNRLKEFNEERYD